jgi:hypothetical protein
LQGCEKSFKFPETTTFLDTSIEIRFGGLSSVVDDHLAVHYSFPLLPPDLSAVVTYMEIYLPDIPDDVPVTRAELSFFSNDRHG